MTRKVIIMQGIPGSGKSTWAKKFLKEQKEENWVIINKDSIRKMLSQPYSRKLEKLVQYISLRSIRTALDNRYNVIVDDTNLSEKSLNKLTSMLEFWKKVTGTELEIEYKLIEVSLKKALWREWVRQVKRTKPVSFKTVRWFYNTYMK